MFQSNGLDAAYEIQKLNKCYLFLPPSFKKCSSSSLINPLRMRLLSLILAFSVTLTFSLPIAQPPADWIFEDRIVQEEGDPESEKFNTKSEKVDNTKRPIMYIPVPTTNNPDSSKLKHDWYYNPQFNERPNRVDSNNIPPRIINHIFDENSQQQQQKTPPIQQLRQCPTCD